MVNYDIGQTVSILNMSSRSLSDILNMSSGMVNAYRRDLSSNSGSTNINYLSNFPGTNTNSFSSNSGLFNSNYLSGDNSGLSSNYSERQAFQESKESVNSNLKHYAASEKNTVSNETIIASTQSIIDTIGSSDLNLDGVVTREEISSLREQQSQRLDEINTLKARYPQLENYWNSSIDRVMDKFNASTLISENFEVFSTVGESPDVIDGVDLVNIHVQAGHDGKYTDFSEKDLNYFKGITEKDTIEPEKTYDYSDWDNVLRKTSQDRINYEMEIIENSTDTIPPSMRPAHELESATQMNILISNLKEADFDMNGTVSKEELASTKKRLEYNISQAEILEENGGALYDPLNLQKQWSQTSLKSLTFLLENFNTLNSTGNANELDANDVWKMHEASKTDGNPSSLSGQDFQSLTPAEDPAFHIFMSQEEINKPNYGLF